MTTDFVLAGLVLSFLAGIAAFLFAKEKGRNPMIWFVIGFFSSIIGIGLIAFMKKRAQKTR